MNKKILTVAALCLGLVIGASSAMADEAKAVCGGDKAKAAACGAKDAGHEHKCECKDGDKACAEKCAAEHHAGNSCKGEKKDSAAGSCGTGSCGGGDKDKKASCGGADKKEGSCGAAKH